MSSLHPLDYGIIAAYFVILLVVGKIAAHGAKSGDGFFLAGRKLGKVYQFFLNFGNSVAANDAVSTASLVYQQGISGVWAGFQMIFINPYYWFLYPWYRRVRLTTTGDIFHDRLGSRRLALFYATFQIVMAVAVTMGFGNLVAYKISAAIVTKPEAAWTATERASVQDYRELKQLEAEKRSGSLPDTSDARLTQLHEREARGELTTYVTALNPWVFYIVYTLVVGIYIVMGGLAAAALNEAFQGILIIVFSVILIPAGLAAVGGWEGLRATVPARMFDLFGTAGLSDFTGWSIAAVFLATLMQAHAMPGNMAVGGSAKNEFAARFGGVAGTFGKRLVTITWGVCGLIGVAIYSGTNALVDPDAVWGAMSLKLLGPGLLGLMLAGVLAAQMSTISSQAMSVSALFAHNVYRNFRPAATELDLVSVGRWTLVVVLTVGVLISSQMTSVYTVLQFAMTINVPFGASILLMFVWRRLTAPAVWWAVGASALCNILFPLVAQHVPALTSHPTLTARTVDAAGRPVSVFFERVVRADPTQTDGALQGSGRLHTELVLLQGLGVDVPGLSSGGRLAGRFFVDALLPLAILFGVSLLTRTPPREQVDQFYGKMRTPVGETPELDQIALEETRRNPRRFDHQKLFPSSSFEVTRWDRVDAIGFTLTCGVTLAILGLFIGFLRLIGR